MGTCANHNSIVKGSQTGCSVCDLCNSCNVGSGGSPSAPVCNNKQTVCTDSPGKGQQAKSYVDPGVPQVKKGDIIIKKFDKTKMNELIRWIKKMANYGLKQTSTVPTIGEEGRNFIYADKINEIVDALKTVYSGNSGSHVAADQVIKASQFQEFLNAIQNMKFDPVKACDLCVSGCDIHCNTCNDCVTCQRNNSGTMAPPGICGASDITPPGACSEGPWNGTICNNCNYCQGCNACLVGNTNVGGGSCQRNNICSTCNTCQTCNYCEGCVTCNGCNTCQGCNYCNTCQGCDYCNVCQGCNYCNYYVY